LIRKIFLACFFTLLTTLLACSNVTLRPDDKLQKLSGHTHEARQDYFLFGLIGEHHIDVKEKCAPRKATQIQAQDTLSDSLLKIITFGIYSPRSYRLWCE
jgi:Bor protein